MAFDKFKRKKFTELTSSADLVIRESYRKIPAVLRLGKKNRSQGTSNSKSYSKIR